MSISSFSSSSQPSTLSSEIDSLSENQLKRLTRSNTRRNLGTRRSRFMSQLERVCQRLDLLSITSEFISKAPASPRLQAIPIVNPDGTIVRKATESETESVTPTGGDEGRRGLARVQTPRLSSNCTVLFRDESTTDSDTSELIALPHEDEEFLIEPATNCTSTEPGTATTKSFRSVRISSAVTILDYCTKTRKGEPISLSVSTQHRREHPTRNGRSLQLRRGLTEQNSFPRAMRSLEKLRSGNGNGAISLRHDDAESRNGEGSMSTGNCTPRKPPTPFAGSPRKAKQSAKLSPTAAYATRSPNGAYGSRNLCQDKCDS